MHWLPAILILSYTLLILIIYRFLSGSVTFRTSQYAKAYISVIVPCRNEKDSLPHLLRCLAEQDYPYDRFEVIVVDDNSIDGTAEVASLNYEIDLKLLASKNGKGKKEAIRTGIMAAAGDLIITTDADCTMGRNWIGTIAACYEQKKADMIIGPVCLGNGRGFFDRFQAIEFLSLQGVTCGTALAGNPVMCNGANLAFRRKIYLEHNMNLIPELPSGDDIFLLHSLKRVPGAVIEWLESPEAMVKTASSPDIISFLKQRRRWISKWNHYRDRLTIASGLITFLAVLLVLFTMVAAFFDTGFILPLLTVLILKSVPDFLVIRNRALKYGKKELLHWFVPAQLIYPLYVLGVILFSLIPARKGGT